MAERVPVRRVGTEDMTIQNAMGLEFFRGWSTDQTRQQQEQDARLEALENLLYRPNGKDPMTQRLDRVEQTLAGIRKLGWGMLTLLLGLLLSHVMTTYVLRPPPPPTQQQAPRTP
jgi:hypothetical protein